MNAMKLRKPLGPAVASAIFLTAATLTAGAAFAQHAPAQTAPAQDSGGSSGASMVKPPAQTPGGSDNPDHMPVRKPRKPTNDKMMHYPPASAANAK
jgi:hypothetical protein